MPELENIAVEDVDPDPENPREVFPAEELERLAASIDDVGILVPIVVSRDGNRYRLIDGDRRWQCAEQLGLQEIPAMIVERPDDRTRLVQMFNIHQVREKWQNMPTARALEKLIDQTGIADDQDLSDRTGLSVELVKRYKHALELPREYQQLIHDGTVPLNFFWELKRNVLDPLRSRRPDLLETFSEEDVVRVFIEKRLHSLITDTVSLRKVRPIINSSADDRDTRGESSLDATLVALLQDNETTIDDAYEETVMVMVEAGKLQRRAEAMQKGFERLLEHASTDDEREEIVSIARNLAAGLNQLISNAT